MNEPRLPYLVFLGDARTEVDAKTGFGVAHWRPDACVAQWRFPDCNVDLRMPNMTPHEAVKAGAKSLLIGVAPFGGQIQENWITPFCGAIKAGLDIVSGMHTPLSSVGAIREAAEISGRTLHDLRHSAVKFSVGTGVKRSGKRLLTVGTDCALGKKYTALALTNAFRASGHDATFRATGQTGIMISGAGIAIDAVVADFISGAAEWLSPANAPGHWDIIEGQGSLIHPAYAGVSLGLLHGSQPDALVLCHDPNRREIDGYSGFTIPPLDEVMALHLSLAQRTNLDARFVGIALNTEKMEPVRRQRVFAEIEALYQLPVVDPLKSDLSAIVVKAIS